MLTSGICRLQTSINVSICGKSSRKIADYNMAKNARYLHTQFTFYWEKRIIHGKKPYNSPICYVEIQ